GESFYEKPGSPGSWGPAIGIPNCRGNATNLGGVCPGCGGTFATCPASARLQRAATSIKALFPWYFDDKPPAGRYPKRKEDDDPPPPPRRLAGVYPHSAPWTSLTLSGKACMKTHLRLNLVLVALTVFGLSLPRSSAEKAPAGARVSSPEVRYNRDIRP